MMRNQKLLYERKYYVALNLSVYFRLRRKGKIRVRAWRVSGKRNA